MARVVDRGSADPGQSARMTTTQAPPNPSAAQAPPRTARPRPWYLGTTPVPDGDLHDPAAIERMRKEVGRLGLVRDCRDTLGFIGPEGRRLTRQGRPYVADMKAYARSTTEPEDDFDPRWGLPEEKLMRGVDGAWPVLVSQGWIVVEDGRVRWSAEIEDSGLVGSWGEPGVRSRLGDQALEGWLDILTDRLEARVDSASFGYSYGLGHEGSASEQDAVLEALLIASGDGGLRLPWVPEDGRVVHCFEVQSFYRSVIAIPGIEYVPDPGLGEHPGPDQLGGVVDLGRTLGDLEDLGVWRTPGHGRFGYRSWRERETEPDRFHAPFYLREVVARIRARRPEVEVEDGPEEEWGTTDVPGRGMDVPRVGEIGGYAGPEPTTFSF
jgi:hypothetical protein